MACATSFRSATSWFARSARSRTVLTVPTKYVQAVCNIGTCLARGSRSGQGLQSVDDTPGPGNPVTFSDADHRRLQRRDHRHPRIDFDGFTMGKNEVARIAFACNPDHSGETRDARPLGRFDT